MSRRQTARDRTEKRAYFEHGWWHLTSQDDRQED